MLVVVVEGRALIISGESEAWDAAATVNPGILPDEYAVYPAQFFVPDEAER